jgi:hypothetical protein
VNSKNKNLRNNSKILNSSDDGEAIPESIKYMLQDNIDESNANNLKNLIKDTKEEEKNYYNSTYNKILMKSENTSISSGVHNKPNIIIPPIDPFEFTLKIIKFKEDEEINKLKKMANQSVQTNRNVFQKNSGYMSKSMPTNNDVIFDHIFINSNGEKNSNMNWKYDNLVNEFIIPDESKLIL